jgi:DNA uptake protein ComE-like DNA-binding protein
MEKINIHKANYDDFKKISGLDENKIGEIMKYLENHSPISNIKELKNINGIDDSIIEQISQHFSFGEEEKEEKTK